ncbi:MAG TPA: neutral/alkaline non-lysosomal ceramidase N-terminal domain-containing protein [Chloroflexota bacterium]|nr:neutral/alkaline non-lysosomal ceramidase N-terminal domain-containing protein [Chloroflexota bacterium]
MADLQAGAATVCITPPVGVALAGYSGRAGNSTGIHDDLYGKALVLDDGRSPLAVVTLDLIGLDDQAVQQIRDRVAEQTNIPAAHVMVAASHTHSGPMPAFAESPYQRLRTYGWTPDEDWTRTLLKSLSGAVVAAWHRRQPARIGIGGGELHGLAYNRRRFDSGGVPTDPSVPVMLVAGADDRPLAVLYSYACHPVTQRESNLLISADYPGVASRLIEQTFPGAVALFANGCCGDQDPRHAFWGRYEGTTQAGLMVGSEVIQVVARLAANRETASDFTLSAASRRMTMPMMPQPDRAAAAALVREQEQFLEELRRKETQPGHHLFPRGEPWHSMIPERYPTVGLAEMYVQWARALQALAEAGTVLEPPTAEIQVLQVGPAVLAGLPGEIFVQLGLTLKDAWRERPAFVCGYTNGLVGYVPTREAYAEGGYEVTVAQRARLLPLAPEAGERMVATALALV